MDQLFDRPLGALLEDVAAATPAPGGGSTAAVVCALAAGLVQMVAAITLERGGEDARVRLLYERSETLREAAAGLADVELEAYAPVLDAMRRPRDDAGRTAAIDAALSRAADSPLRIARTAADIAQLAAEIAERGRPQLHGDALTGVLLAEAAAVAAARLAAINLAGRPGDERHAELARVARDAAAARAEALF